jgi:hypothetical protein
MNKPSPVKTIRDLGPYSGRNTSKGALLDESYQIIGAIAAGIPLEQVREQAHQGQILRQKARLSRTTIWKGVHLRLLAHGSNWFTETLKTAQAAGRYSLEFISTVYLLYCLRDHLTFDFVTHWVFPRWNTGQRAVSPDDLLDFLDQASEDQPQIRRWTETSRDRLSSSILTALRDYGLLKGVRNKEIIKPPLPLITAESILRLLTEEGHRGADVIDEPTWRLFLLSPSEVAHMLLQLSQQNRIRFEKVGGTVVLETSEEWSTT